MFRCDDGASELRHQVSRSRPHTSRYMLLLLLLIHVSSVHGMDEPSSASSDPSIALAAALATLALVGATVAASSGGADMSDVEAAEPQQSPPAEADPLLTMMDVSIEAAHGAEAAAGDDALSMDTGLGKYWLKGWESYATFLAHISRGPRFLQFVDLSDYIDFEASESMATNRPVVYFWRIQVLDMVGVLAWIAEREQHYAAQTTYWREQIRSLASAAAAAAAASSSSSSSSSSAASE
jgi:hypothetical protein